MSLRQSLVPWIAMLAFVPVPVVAQPTPEAQIADPGLVELVVLGLIVYAVYVAFSVAVGVVVLLVSEFVLSGSFVRAVEERIRDRPVRSGVLGLGATVGGFVAFVLLVIALLLLTAVGVPEPVGLLAAIPFFGGVLFLSVASTIGTIVLGSSLLRRFGRGESNLWVALVVGALVVNVPLLNLVLALPVLFLGTGAMVGQWWDDDDTSGSRRRRWPA